MSPDARLVFLLLMLLSSISRPFSVGLMAHLRDSPVTIMERLRRLLVAATMRDNVETVTGSLI